MTGDGGGVTAVGVVATDAGGRATSGRGAGTPPNAERSPDFFLRRRRFFCSPSVCEPTVAAEIACGLNVSTGLLLRVSGERNT